MRWRYLIIAIVLGVLLIAGAAYHAIIPGLSSARTTPSAFEVEVATYLLHHSVPNSAVAHTNPLDARTGLIVPELDRLFVAARTVNLGAVAFALVFRTTSGKSQL